MEKCQRCIEQDGCHYDHLNYDYLFIFSIFGFVSFLASQILFVWLNPTLYIESFYIIFELNANIAYTNIHQIRDVISSFLIFSYLFQSKVASDVNFGSRGWTNFKKRHFSMLQAFLKIKLNNNWNSNKKKDWIVKIWDLNSRKTHFSKSHKNII